MARYRGPKTKVAKRFKEPIFGPDKYFDRKGGSAGSFTQGKRRKKVSEYGLQLQEKQKAKYTYGLLEKQFRNIFDIASRKKGVTGEILLQLIEARLDNVVYRLGLSPSRAGARQLVSHKHILLNGKVVNIPSVTLRPGDVVAVREKSKSLESIVDALSGRSSKYQWLEWNSEELSGTFIEYPVREQIPENIKEQLIVELYSK